MNQLDYTLLTAMNAVIREGSFDAAARSLNITQSAVSQRIKLLEERIGGVVIQRTRPCRATDLGLELARHVEEVSMLEHDLLSRLGDTRISSGGSSLPLKVAVNHDSLATWFSPVVARASSQLNIQMHLQVCDRSETLSMLQSGNAVAAISSDAAHVQGYKRMAIGSMSYVAVCSPSFRDTYFSAGVTRQTLRDAPAIFFSGVDKIITEWAREYTGEELAFEGHEVPSQGGFIECCKMGAGFGVLPIDWVRDELESGELCEVVPAASLDVPLYWYSGSRRSRVLDELTAIVGEVGLRSLASPNQIKRAS